MFKSSLWFDLRYYAESAVYYRFSVLYLRFPIAIKMIYCLKWYAISTLIYHSYKVYYSDYEL